MRLRHLTALLLTILTTTSQLDAQSAWVESNRGLEGAQALSLAIDSTGRALAVTSCGVYRHESGGWRQILHDTYVHSLLVSPDGSILAGTTRGLWRQEVGDTAWTRPATGSVVAAMTVTPSSEILVTIDRFLWRSTDSGATWAADGRLPQTAAYGIAALDDGTLFAWGTTLERSTNGGATWTQMNDWLPASTILPLSRERLLGARPDSLLASSDGGRTWSAVAALATHDLRLGAEGILAVVGYMTYQGITQEVGPGVYELDTSGAIVRQLHRGLAHRALFTDRGSVVNASPDMLLSSDRGATWRLDVRGLDCGRVDSMMVDAAGRMYALYFGRTWLSNRPELGVLHRSEDSGRTWRRTSMRGARLLGVYGSGEVVAMTAHDSANITMIAWSGDRGETVEAMPAPGAFAAIDGNDSGAVAISFARGSMPDDSTGWLWLSTDTARTWERRPTGARSGFLFVEEGNVILEGAVSDQVLARSTDRGATWSEATGFTIGARVMRAPGGLLYAITRDSQLWSSSDGGSSWYKRTNLPSVSRDPLLFLGNDILMMPSLGTDGRMIRSTNGGDDWHYLPAPWVDTVRLALVDGGRLIAYRMKAADLRVWESTDAGESWRTMVHPPLAGATPQVTPWGELFAWWGQENLRVPPPSLMRLASAISSVPRERIVAKGMTILVTPNPTRGAATLTLEHAGSGDMTIAVHSLDGTLALPLLRHDATGGSMSLRLPLESLAPGIYVVIVTEYGRAVATRTVVVW